jgi:lipoprotein-anchoring transpeptidase ErfK/SrfK
MNTLEKSLIIGTATVASVAVINKVDAASYGSYITTNNLNLRASMSTSSQKLVTIPKGGKVTLVMKYSNGWSKVTYNGRTGYVSTQYIKAAGSSNNTTPTPSPSPSYGKTARTTAVLNLRRGAGTSYTSIMKIPSNATVTIIARYNNGWSKVNYSGKVGFVSSQYLTTGAQSNNNNNNSSRCTSGYATNTLIIVDKNSRRVNFYRNCRLVRSMPCAIGKASTQTPSGKYRVLEKIQNRPYYKDHIAGGDPRNPLGKYWLGIGNGYALHGTNNEGSIGGAVSHGCMRMYNSDIQWLYSQAKVGTTVLIDNGSTASIATKYRFKIYY